MRLFFLFLVSFYFSLSSVHASAPVYDGTVCPVSNVLSSAGVHKVDVIYEWRIWGRNQDRSKLPQKSAIDAVFLEVTSKHVVLDIENWEGLGDSSQELVEKYATVAKWARAAKRENNIKIGFYGVVPIRDYWGAVLDNSPRNHVWKKSNLERKLIANYVDILYPSAYTFYKDIPQWVAFAEAQVSEARKIAEGKPVFLFIWPKFHDSNKLLRGSYIGDSYFKVQLDVARRVADGVVVWDKNDCSETTEWRQYLRNYLSTTRG